MKKINFWCDICKKDIGAPAHNTLINETMGMGWVSTCDKGHKVVRLQDINAKHDPYFRKSLIVKRQIRRNSDALLQVSSNKFNQKYSHHAKAKAEREEKEHYQEWLKKQ